MRDTKIMAKQDKENDKDLRAGSLKNFTGEELDVSGRSLSEALRFSFIILKIIMIAGGCRVSGFRIQNRWL